MDLTYIYTLTEGVWALGSSLRERDAQTHLHSRNVVRMTKEWGDAIGLSDTDMEMLLLGAVLHDVGKIGVPDEILLKEGPLTDEEWDVMKSHSEQGESLVRALKIRRCTEVAAIVRHHHEDVSGSGYPDGLDGNEIPMFVKMVSIVDSYDALTERRAYRDAFGHDKAIAILKEAEGHKYDPVLLDQFIALLETSDLQRS